MNKILKKYFIIVSIVLFVFCLMYFLIPFPRESNLVYWITFAATVIAIAAQMLFAYITFKNESAKSKVYGIPILKTGFYYLLIQMILTVIVTIIGAFVIVPYWIIIILYTLVIAYAVIGLIMTDTYREIVINEEKKVAHQTRTIRELTIEAQTLINKTNDENLSKKLNGLYELIRFSDPMSNSRLESIEEEIRVLFNTLSKKIKNKEAVAISEVDELMDLIKERNTKCKLYK